MSPLPFACAYDDGSGSLEQLNHTRVTQCALSRICGVCGLALGRPIVLVGSASEAERNAFHFPPVHDGCARTVLAEVAGWQHVTTGGFEFVRPAREDLDRRPTFQPNSLL